jgi:hypothetical protein
MAPLLGPVFILLFSAAHDPPLPSALFPMLPERRPLTPSGPDAAINDCVARLTQAAQRRQCVAVGASPRKTPQTQIEAPKGRHSGCTRSIDLNPPCYPSA